MRPFWATFASSETFWATFEQFWIFFTLLDISPLLLVFAFHLPLEPFETFWATFEHLWAILRLIQVPSEPLAKNNTDLVPFFARPSKCHWQTFENLLDQFLTWFCFHSRMSLANMHITTGVKWQMLLLPPLVTHRKSSQWAMHITAHNTKLQQVWAFAVREPSIPFEPQCKCCWYNNSNLTKLAALSNFTGASVRKLDRQTLWKMCSHCIQ